MIISQNDKVKIVPFSKVKGKNYKDERKLVEEMASFFLHSVDHGDSSILMVASRRDSFFDLQAIIRFVVSYI